ncbi:MAG TPA: hypothetical protein VF192_15460 [Longimicrobiales bacterium]
MAVIRLAIGTALLCIAAPAAALAQGLRPRPSEADCATWREDLAAGDSAALHAVTYGWLAACDDVGAIALADAIRAAGAERDTAYLFRLATQAAQIRDARVFDAAIGLAEERGASVPARAAAILILTAQLGSGWDYPGVSGAELLTQPLPGNDLCGPGTSSPGFATDNGLPADHRRRAAAVLDAIAQHGHPLLRNLARCSRAAVGAGIPPQIDVSRVRLRNVCGTTFRVHNNTPEFLVFSYTVVGTDETRDLPIQAHDHAEFTTTNEGTVQLLYDGRVIAEESTGKKPCR